MGSYTIPIYDTEGTLRDVPAEQAHDAVAAGGRPGVRFQSPDGKVRYVPADQTQDAIKAGGKLLPFEQQDQGVKAWYGFTPSNVAVNVWNGAKGIIGGSYEVAKDLVNNPNWVQGPDSTFHKFVQAPSDEQVKKASDALEKGNRVEAAGHILASALPLVGPWAAGLGEQAGTGDIGGAVGQAAGMVAGGAAMSAAARGAKAVIPKTAEIVKAGTEGVVKGAASQLAPTPVEAMTTALTRGQLRSTKGVDIAPIVEQAMPDLKKAEAASGRPVGGVDDLITATNAAKKAVWQEYQDKLSQAQAIDAGPLQLRDPQTGRLGTVTREPTINGNEIADAMMKSIDKRRATLDPGLTDRVKAMADTYRRPMTLGEAEDFLQSANNELHNYYAKNKVGRRVAQGDPETASTVAEADQLRDSLYSKLDELTGPGAADIKKRYGALSTVEESALRARATQARQSPQSLPEQLSSAMGAATAIAGHPVAGLAQVGISKWLKARQTTDALISRSFEDYGKPQGALRSLIAGTRGEAGLPGTVSEEDAAPPEDMRRTPEQTRQDIRRVAAATPQLQEAEAQQRARAAEVAQKYPVGEMPREVAQGVTPPPAPGQKPVSYYPGRPEPQPEQPNAPTFYSKAEKAAQKLPGSGTGQQMLATLQNQGVKPGEISSMGLDDFLKAKQRVAAGEVRDFIAKNKLQVGEKDLIEGRARYSDDLPQSLRVDQLSDGKWQAFDNNQPHKVWPKFDTEDQAYQHATEELLEKTGGTKYEQYTLPGEKQNYTERLFTYDPKGSSLEPTADPYEQRRRRIEEGGQQFQSSHWDEPNVLAHARFDERTTADGKRALFLEEAQSDWHQQGKKEGYSKTGAPDVDNLDAALKQMRRFSNMDSADRHQLAYDISRSVEASGMMKESAKMHGLNNEEASLLAEWHKQYGKGVPDAPFKTDWHELVVKRMLREAAERGADRLAWTTGDQQAERYDLSKATGKVQYNPTSGDLLVYDQNGKNVVQHRTIDQGELANYIGKDAADKMMRSPLKEKIYHEITGSDLKVGGEWAKALYDRAIPNFLNKYAKKWGARVGTTELGGKGPMPDVEESPEGYTVVDNVTGNYISRDMKRWEHMDDDNFDPVQFKTEAEARRFIETNKQRFPGFKAQTVHSIDITPAMRKAVLKEGQPIASAATFGDERAG